MKRRITTTYTCSDYHFRFHGSDKMHPTKLGAWLCGRWQWIIGYTGRYARTKTLRMIVALSGVVASVSCSVIEFLRGHIEFGAGCIALTLAWFAIIALIRMKL